MFFYHTLTYRANTDKELNLYLTWIYRWI